MTVNPALSGRLTLVAKGNVGGPRLSADGSTVVYSRWNKDNWDVERHRDDGTKVVSNDPRQDLDPQVNDNGDVIVWSRYSHHHDDPKASQDVYRWENGDLERVADSQANEQTPDVSGDGETVVYTYDDTSKPIGFDIHRCREGLCEELTSDWPVDTNPQIAGERVFFRRKVKFDGGDLWMSDESGQIKQLTHDSHQESQFTASADGNVLAWAKMEHRDSDNDIFVYDTSKGKTERIGEIGIDESQPALSADGSVLAYTSAGKGRSHIMLRENGETIQVTKEFSRSPSLSADGQVLAWAQSDPNDPSKMMIYKLDRRG